MSPTALELERPTAAAEGGAAGRPDGITLEDLVLSVTDELAAAGTAECPVCRGPMQLSGCTGCGSRLS